MSANFDHHAVDLLRQDCLRQSTRIFNARGADVKRCPQCLLGRQTCICDYRQAQDCGVDTVLIMHRDEVHKPTNSGRLIADLFPRHTWAFLWDRLNPDQRLLAMLSDPQRQCCLVFPALPGQQRTLLQPTGLTNDRRLTLIVLDGTWKQARKMFSQGQWLKELPLLDMNTTLAQYGCGELGNYPMRQTAPGNLSTAEATAVAMAASGAGDNASALLSYFGQFSHHYMAMRMNRKP